VWGLNKVCNTCMDLYCIYMYVYIVFTLLLRLGDNEICQL
jgi:hypothetical protein